MDDVIEQQKAQELFEQTKNKSDDDYEKNLTYISAGTLVLSLTFLEKVIKLEESHSTYFLIISWALMAVTLGVNLVSHQLSSVAAEKAIEELPLSQSDPATFVQIVQGRNKRLRKLNWITTGTLTGGMVCLIIFCSINALKPKQADMAEDRKIHKEASEQKGRTVTIPVSVLNAAKEVQSQPASTSDTSSAQTTASSQKKD